jgi:hypothetical protein
LSPSETLAEKTQAYAPPFWWRALFWALMSAWLTSIAVAALSVLLSAGFGVIALFAGSLEGFTKFSLRFSQLNWLFFTPLVLFVLLYAIRHFIRAHFVVAGRTERVMGFLLGATIGVIVTTSAVLSLLRLR